MKPSVVPLAALLLAFAGAAGAAEVVRVAYFPNLTHATALVGLQKGFFAAALGRDVAIEPKVFNAGPAEIEALFAGEVDLGYIGSAPAITGYVRSKARGLRVIAGAASGGASFVVAGGASIREPRDLAGKKLASPQIGNTQDVALRTYLRAAGLQSADHGGSVTVLPVANPDIVTLFAKQQLDGAWVPEPWASVLRLKSGGRELVDERSLWPNGRFPTTVLVASSDLLKRHPDWAVRWLRGQLETTRWIGEHADEARAVVDEAIRALTTREIPAEVLREAWARLEFTDDPIADAFPKLAREAVNLGYLPDADVSSIFDPGPLGEAKR